MLVLTRKLGEKVVVRDGTGKQIGSLTVLETRTGQAKLGFDFDGEYKLLRLEVAMRDEPAED